VICSIAVLETVSNRIQLSVSSTKIGIILRMRTKITLEELTNNWTKKEIVSLSKLINNYNRGL